MDRAARLINRGFLLARDMLEPGISSRQLAEEINAFLAFSGADSGTVIRISPEAIAWHGIPGAQQFEEGQIVTIDIACSLRGWWADGARSFAVGSPDEKRENLLKAALEATRTAVRNIREGHTGEQVSRELKLLCRERGVSLVPEGAGHGIGARLHETPSLTYDGRIHDPLEAGRVYTAEPILSAGDGNVVISPTGEAAGTDGEPTAHFEVSVLSLTEGNQVLGDPDWLWAEPC